MPEQAVAVAPALATLAHRWHKFRKLSHPSREAVSTDATEFRMGVPDLPSLLRGT